MLPRWVRAIVAIAGVQVAASLAAGLVQLLPQGRAAGLTTTAILYLITLSFAATATILLYGGRDDLRAQYLGVVLLLSATAFGIAPMAGLARAIPALAPLLALLIDLPLTAFLPYFFWSFVGEFPRASARSSDAVQVRWARAITLALGAALFAWNAVAPLLAGDEPFPWFLHKYLRSSEPSIYWDTLFVMQIPALALILIKSRRAPVDERRRVRLFVAALLLGVAPLYAAILLEQMVPAVARALEDPAAQWLARLIVWPPLLLVPFAVAYAVLRHQVMDVRLVVRRALRYALAKYSILALAVLPFAVLGMVLYRNRDQPLAALLTGPQAAVLVAMVAVAALVWHMRARMMDALDRRFFREQYDARTILADLAERIRLAPDESALEDLLRREIDRALHVETLGLLVRHSGTGQLVDPAGRIRPLSLDGALVAELEGRAAPLTLDIDLSRTPLRGLPEEERDWMVDSGFRVLLPMLGADGGVVGLMGVGDKRSELPFSSEDRDLLAAVSSAAGLAIENRYLAGLAGAAPDSGPRTPDSGGAGGSEDATADDQAETWTSLPEAADDAGLLGATDFNLNLARECPRCGTVYPSTETRCGACGVDNRISRVPYVLAGKFRLEARVGRGGMGIVYRAVDVVLGRKVALKTLPRLSPHFAVRLRREARAMALVTHPALAVIHGAESWRGMPILIFEYLEGGTLADKIKAGRLPLRDTLEIGYQLADVTDRIHAAGVLHRDIKPSNIGFTARDAPKLLDFGLSHALASAVAPRRGDITQAISEDSGEPAEDLDRQSLFTFSKNLVGTPLYMSPEALAGRAPDPSFDLWGLALVLYEALAGVNPLRERSLTDTLERIRAADIPDLRDLVEGTDARVATFFRDALAADRSARPRSAAVMRDQIVALTRAVAPGD